MSKSIEEMLADVEHAVENLQLELEDANEEVEAGRTAVSELEELELVVEQTRQFIRDTIHRHYVLDLDNEVPTDDYLRTINELLEGRAV